MESLAFYNFIKNYKKGHSDHTFQHQPLEGIIGTIKVKKIPLLLFLHLENDTLSDQLCSILISDNRIFEHFFILPWNLNDVEVNKYLINACKQYLNFEIIIANIKNQESGAFLLYVKENSIYLLSGFTNILQDGFVEDLLTKSKDPNQYCQKMVIPRKFKVNQEGPKHKENVESSMPLRVQRDRNQNIVPALHVDKKTETFLEIINANSKKCKVKFEESAQLAVSNAIKEEVPMLLHLFKRNDSLSESMCSILSNEDINDLFNNYRVFVWDMSNNEQNELFLTENEYLNHEDNLKRCITVEKSAILIYQTTGGVANLKDCYDEFSSEEDLFLKIYSSHIEHEELLEESLEILEKHVVVSANAAIGNDLFQDNTLKNAIESTLNIKPLYKQKILVVYFHKSSDNFWVTFQDFLNNLTPEIKYACENLFYFLSWDIEDKKNHEVLKKILRNQFECPVLESRIDNSEASLFFFASCNDEPSLVNALNENVDIERFKTIFEDTIERFTESHQITIMDEYRSCSYSSAHCAGNQIIKPIESIINEYALCFPVKLRKMILFHTYSSDDQFSTNILQALKTNSKFKKYLQHYFFLSWNVSHDDINLNNLVISAHRSFGLQCMEKLIRNKQSGLYLFMPIGQSLTLVSYMHGKSSIYDVCCSMRKNSDYFRNEVEIESNLPEDNKDKFGPTYYQQMMYDGLGDRDYDCFKINEDDQKEALKKKIAFAYYGPPSSETGTGYNDKQWAIVIKMYTKLVPIATKYNLFEDEVVLTCIFNCVTPLPKRKLERLNVSKECDYDPSLDFSVVPIFVLRKCVDCPNRSPCRIFIDQDLRVYDSWDAYLTNNKLPKGIFIVPQGGKYHGDANGNVRMQYQLSPACGWGSCVLKGADIGSAVVGVGAGVVGTAAMIAAIPVAPVVAAGAVMAGLGVGMYSIVRSTLTMYDRVAHQESISFGNSEARGAYFNIVAGTLGLTGSGTTLVLPYLAKNGTNIGRITRGAVDGLKGANILINGAAVANTTYDVIKQWFQNNDVPNTLTVIQLSSSILFFGHAVYNARTGNVIVTKAHAESLQEINRSLRSNRQRRMFNMLANKHITFTDSAQPPQTELVSNMKNLVNHEEILTVLSTLNEKLLDNNIKVTLNNEEIMINGMKVDKDLFSAQNHIHRNNFLYNLPEMINPNVSRIKRIMAKIQNFFSSTDTYVADLWKHLQNSKESSEILANVMNFFSDYVQNKILVLLKNVLQRIFLNVDFRMSLISVCPKEVEIVISVLEVIIEYYTPMYAENNLIKCIEYAIILSTRSMETTIVDLIKYVNNWIISQAYSKCLNDENKSSNCLRTRTPCDKCNGFYYC